MGLPPPLILLPHSFPTPDSGLIPHPDEKRYAMHIVVSYPLTTQSAANTSPSAFSAIPSLGGRSLGEDPSLQKITWNATTKTVIYRSKRHHTTKRNFEIFNAPDFIDAALLHIPPKGQQTVRYYGIYSNKSRGQISLIPDRIIRLPKPEPPPEKPPPAQILLIPAPPKRRACDMRPLWRDLILKVWGGDPLECPCCKGTMKPVRKVIRREEIEKRRRLVGVLDRNPRSG